MKIQPLGDRVLLERFESEVQKTAGGIFLPDSAKEKPQEAKVVAVGPGKKDDTGKIVAMNVAEGDIVLTSKWGGTEIKVDGKEYIIVSEDDILAKVVK